MVGKILETIYSTLFVSSFLLTVFVLDWTHLTQKLPSKTSYRRKDKGED
jgi:hypothetical protein